MKYQNTNENFKNYHIKIIKHQETRPRLDNNMNKLNNEITLILILLFLLLILIDFISK